jgi:hypothetical protein
MSRIVAWTGHRPDIFEDPLAARGVIETIARDLVAYEGAERFLVGGQRGVDTWAAEAALVCNVPFTLLLPLEVGVLVAVWTLARVAGSGTAETIAFARAVGTPIREVVLPIARMTHLPRGRGI